jgi:hypothetical protein
MEDGRPKMKRNIRERTRRGLVDPMYSKFSVLTNALENTSANVRMPGGRSVS